MLDNRIHNFITSIFQASLIAHMLLSLFHSFLTKEESSGRVSHIEWGTSSQGRASCSSGRSLTFISSADRRSGRVRVMCNVISRSWVDASAYGSILRCGRVIPVLSELLFFEKRRNSASRGVSGSSISYLSSSSPSERDGVSSVKKVLAESCVTRGLVCGRA